MKPEIKEKWLAALRSGDYRQTQGVLEATDPGTGMPTGNCCLGVLARVVGAEALHEKDRFMAEFHFGPSYGVGAGYPPADWLHDVCGIGGDDDMAAQIASDLAQKNDAGEPFTKIADYIEENL